MSSGKDVRAGGAYVEVFVKDDQLPSQLSSSNQKIRTAVNVSKSILVSAGSSVATAAAGGYVAMTLVAKGVANAVGSTAAKVTSLVKGNKAGLDSTSQALQRITPLSMKLWDFTSSGIMRGSRALGSFRELLASAGPAADPLLQAFDGMGSKLEGIAARAKRVALILGDKQTAAVAREFQQRGQQATIATARARGGRFGIVGDAFKTLRSPLATIEALQGLSINPGQALAGLRQRFGQVGLGSIGAQARIFTQRGIGAGARGALSFGNAATMGALSGLISGTQRLARSMAGIPSQRTAAGIDSVGRQSSATVAPINRAVAALGKLRSVAVSTFSTLKSGSSSLGRMSAGILAPLTAAAALNVGSVSDLFTSKGFAQHGTDIFDAAKKKGVSAENYSATLAASKLSGISLDEAKDDPAKAAELQSHIGRAASLGAVVTTDQAKMAKEATVAMSELSIATRAIGTALGSAVLPQITSTVRWTVQLATAVAGWVQQNPKLIQQVFTIGKVMGVAAAVAGTLGAVFAFATTPIGMVTIAVGALTAMFPSLLAESQGALGWLTSGLSTLKQDFDDTFGGMTDAIAGGNLALAAQVLWAGLTLEFNRGWSYLNAGWLDAKNSTIGVIDELLTSLRVKLDEWFPGFEQGWSSTLAFINDAWTMSVNTLLDSWDAGFSILKKSLNYLRSLFDSTFNLQGANQAIDDQFAKSVGERTNGQDKLLQQRNAEREKRNADLAKRGTAAVLRDEQQQRKEEREAAAADATKADQQALDSAKARLAQLRKQASQERATKQEALVATINDGASKAGKGAAEANRRGVDAQDIRTQGGLSVLAQAARGTSSQKMLQLQQGLKKEAELANQWNQKNWVQLTELNQNLPLPAIPIG